ncbi:MAG: hypothetical protein WC680_10145 [Sulfuricurvum sp.]|jgi:hypothetical protein
MDKLDKKLSNGEITCKVWHKDILIEEFVPKNSNQLFTMIDIPGDEQVKGNYLEECLDFIKGGKKKELYKSVACKNIYKFGDLFHQYTEEYFIEFEDTYAWYRRPIAIIKNKLLKMWEFLIYKQNGYQNWPHTIAFKTYRWKK